MPAEDECEAVQVRQLIPFDRDRVGLVQQLTKSLRGEVAGQPIGGVGVDRPDAQVGVRALVARAAIDQLAERDQDVVRLVLNRGNASDVVVRLARVGLRGHVGYRQARPVHEHHPLADLRERRQARKVLGSGGDVHGAVRVPARVAAEAEPHEGGVEPLQRLTRVRCSGDEDRHRRLPLAGRVDDRLPHRPHAQLGQSEGLDESTQLNVQERDLLGRLEAGDEAEERRLESAFAKDANLCGEGGRPAGGARDADAIPRLGLDVDAVHVDHDVGVQVVDALDLVEQLCGDGVDGHRTARTGVLGDDERAVLRDLRDGESEHDVVGDRRKAGEVAARGLRAALDDVTGDDGAGHPVPIVRAPAMPPGRGPADETRIGDAPAYHDVRAGLQRLDNAPPAQVAIRGDKGLGRQDERVARVEVVQLACLLQPRDPVQEVVALDVRDREVESLLGDDVAERVSEPAGVECAGVDDDLDAPFGDETEFLPDLREERRRVEVLLRGGVATEQGRDPRHGRLGEVVAHDDVEVAAVEDLGHRGEAIS